MPDLTRRSFFKIAAGAAALPVAAKLALALPAPPILYGDGAHDDTVAMQALIDGDVVEFFNPEMAKGAGWFGECFHMPKGVFRTCSELVFDISHAPGAVINGEGSKLEVVTAEECRSALCLKNAEGATLTNLWVDCTMSSTPPKYCVFISGENTWNT